MIGGGAAGIDANPNHNVAEAAQHQIASTALIAAGAKVRVVERNDSAACQKQSGSSGATAIHRQSLSGGDDRRLLQPIDPIITQRVDRESADIIGVREARTGVSKYQIGGGPRHAGRIPIGADRPVATGGIIPGGGSGVGLIERTTKRRESCDDTWRWQNVFHIEFSRCIGLLMNLGK